MKYTREMRSLTDWTVDYGDGNGEIAVRVPHSWKQEVKLEFEGPVWYRTRLDVPFNGAWLLFEGVSYFATVFIDGCEVGSHEGIWDAFSISLLEFAGKTVILSLKVVKNGGGQFPVNEVLSGGIPEIFHTFGGIFGSVVLAEGTAEPLVYLPSAPCRLRCEGDQLLLDLQPFSIRGVVHRGWFPEVGHPNILPVLAQQELHTAGELGFNTFQFCGWLPPHHYLDSLHHSGFTAWIQLPTLPSAVVDRQRLIHQIKRIVLQYRHHLALIGWTVCVETSENDAKALAHQTLQVIQALSEAPVNLRVQTEASSLENGLTDIVAEDTVLIGDRATKASREFKITTFRSGQVHRDFPKILEAHPFWASALPEFNSPGMRDEMALPDILRVSAYAHEPRAAGHDQLLSTSLSKQCYAVAETALALRTSPHSLGYFLADWRDNPVSSRGVNDDFGRPRMSVVKVKEWNSEACLRLSVSGDLPNAETNSSDPFNRWIGPNRWLVDLAGSDRSLGGALWSLRFQGTIVAEGMAELIVGNTGQPECHILANLAVPGEYDLVVEASRASASWKIFAYDASPLAGEIEVPASDTAAKANCIQAGLRVVSADAWGRGQRVIFPDEKDTLSAPFWGDCTLRYDDLDFCAQCGLIDNWARIAPFAPDRAIDPGWLNTTHPGAQSIITRVDTRTYDEAPLLVRLDDGSFLTTFRPFGGLNSQPSGLAENPSGYQFLRDLFAGLG